MPETITRAPAWITAPELKQLFDALGAPAVDVRCVGGCVRDAVIGRVRIPVEIDIGTPESPDRVVARLKAAGLRAIPTGIDHGTVTAVVNGRTFEITSLRRDTACDGRHAAVEFTTDWHEDARRRDFTMNAMSMGLDGVVHDDHGGVADAGAGRVRFVGAANDRIQEDYLRILRLFRFAALYGREPIDVETLAACRRHKDGLGRLSAERVHDELAKLLAAGDPVAAVRQMETAEVLGAILPGHRDVGALARLVEIEREVPSDCWTDVVNPAWVRRLAALIPSRAIDATAARLKLSNDERARLESAAGDAITPSLSAIDVGRQLFRHGAAAVMDRVLVSWATASGARTAGWPALIASVCAWVPRPLPVGGADVMALGIPPGPEIGRVLAAMTEWWVTAGFQPDRAGALDELKRIVGTK